MYKFRNKKIKIKDLEISSICLKRRNQEMWLERKQVSNRAFISQIKKFGLPTENNGSAYGF